MRPYVVTRDCLYLGLNGPFAYPRWFASVTNADSFTFSMACAWAAAYGGSAVAAGVAA